MIGARIRLPVVFGLGAVSCLTGILMVTAIPDATGQEPGPGERVSGLVVFLSYQGAAPLAGDATRMRLSGGALLAGVLETCGYRVVPYAEIETVMRRWRVRCDRDLSPGFLEDLGTGLAVDRVTVARLDIYRDRLILLVRCVSVDSGDLIEVEVVEEPCGDLWSDPGAADENWNDAVVRAGRILGERWREHEPFPGSETLAVLPVQGVGVGAGHSDVASYCLLRTLLEEGRWTMPDPSLVQCGVLESGTRPGALTPEVRGAIQAGFRAGKILQPGLVSFGQEAATPAGFYGDDDAVSPVPYELEIRIPVFLTLMLVDSASGTVLAGGGEYLEPENPSGLFGIAREVRASGRLTRGTNRLVAEVLPRKGEGNR